MTSDQHPLNAHKKLAERLDVDFALQAAGLGIWEYDPITNRVLWDERCRALFGLSADNPMSYEQAFEHVHPDDAPRVSQAAQWAMNPASDGLFDQTYRTIGIDDGTLRWVHFQGRVDFTPTGQVHRFVGVAQEVTQRVLDRQKLEESEAHLQLLRDTVPAMIFYLDAQQRYQSYNKVFKEWFNVGDEVIGKTVQEFIGEKAYQALEPHLARAYEGQTELYDMHAPTRMNAQRWLSIVYTPHKDQAGKVIGVIVHATDISQSKQAQQALQASEARFRSLIQEAPVAMLVYIGPNMVIQEANQLMLTIFGRGDAVLGKPMLEAVPELRDTALPEMYRHVLATGQTSYQYAQRILLLKNDQPYWGYYDYTYKALRDSAGAIYGVICTAIDVSAQVLVQQAAQQSQRQLLDLFEQSPVGIAIISADNLTFRLANPFYGYLVGRLPQDIVDKPLLEALPELAGQGFDDLLRNVLATGTPFIADEVKVDIVRNQRLETIYVNLTYQPRREADNRISGILVVATDVTQQVLTRKKVEEGEAKLRSLIAAAPAGIGLFVGRDLVIEMPNQTFIDIVGKGPAIEGLPLREAMPELLTEGQPFLTILDQVYTTGVPFLSPASLVKIVQNGVLNDNYYNISYVPIRDESDQIYAILDIAIDVTAQVQVQLALEQQTTAFQNAIELAELGTFSVDLATNALTVSPRVANWFGFETLTTDAEAFIGGVGERERDYVRTSLYNTLLPDSDGRYDVIHSVINALTGQQVVIHALGRVYVDTAGRPFKIEGTAQDITAERALQQLLERQVQERTEELAAINEELTASNEELAANNEEYAAINEELEESNSLLTRSNNNLQTFAYVASHDLQEPLRKIQQFGDLLKTRFAGSVSGEELVYLERMQLAASRMSTLIKDLLGFSRIATQRTVDRAVVLNTIVKETLSVLDMVIAEAGAQVVVEELPVVSGDGAQLGQLFQNLISNALKFRRPDVAPRIRISSQRLSVDQLPPTSIPPRRSLSYYRIDVADNGIGFDEKYLDRIFQVFQRLHAKSEYAGTGIGLAICEKVVANHGGALTASSQEGQGATFSVYLPA